jgi:hypothetical protein
MPDYWQPLGDEQEPEQTENHADLYEYELCAKCNHFVDPTGDGHYEHLEDGEQEFDHDAEPSGEVHTGAEWKRLRPDLFKTYPDGKIGPNSLWFDRKGKQDGHPPVSRKLTAEEQAEYIKHRSGTCPWCKHDEIEGDSYDYEGDTVAQRIRCLHCGREWDDVYTLTGIEPTQETK